IAEAVTNPLVWMMAKNKIRKKFIEMGSDIGEDIESFRDLSIQNTSSLMSRVASTFPRDIEVFNLIGIERADGLIDDPKIGFLQNSVVRGEQYSRFLRSGANDGYVEYPGTAVDDNFAENVYTMAANASHIVLDG